MYRAPPKREEDAPPEAAEPAWLGCDYCDRWSHVACELAAAPRAASPTYAANPTYASPALEAA